MNRGTYVIVVKLTFVRDIIFYLQRAGKRSIENKSRLILHPKKKKKKVD